MKIICNINKRSPYENLVYYVKEKLIPNGFTYRYFDNTQFLAFNRERNIVFYVGDVSTFDSSREYFQQPVKDKRFHDIRRYKSFESCYPEVCDFPVFDGENFLSLYCPRLDDANNGFLNISLAKIKTFSPLWEAIGEENRNICENSSKQKVKTKIK